MNALLKAVLALSLAVIIAASGFLGGFAVARFGGPEEALPSLTPQPTGVSDHVDEVLRILKRDALNPPSDTSATAGAVQGLIEVGDAYGTYFDPRHFEYFNEEMSGEFGGIGVSLGEKDGRAYVIDVFDDTPAARAGLKPNDRFLAIDGERRDKWISDDVVKRVRGKEGTKVELTMIRPGKKGVPGKEFTVTLTREMITFPNVISEMKQGVGYIRLGQFNDNATKEIAEAVRSLEKKGARSLVLDLRDNPGGGLQQAVTVASLFIDKGVVVRVEERGKDEEQHSVQGGKITDAPLVVLINGNSASASEIVAGALQDYDRAVLVGEKSFGKGSVQTIEELSFGGAIKFTTAHYLTPKRRVINGKGLTPDIEVTMDLEKQADDKTDIQLKRAIAEAKRMD